MRIPSLMVTAVLVLVACSASRPDVKSVADNAKPVVMEPASGPVVVPARGASPYTLLTPEDTGIATVFDDGRRTYLTFVESVPAGLLLFDQDGRPVSFRASADAVVVNSLHLGLLLRTPTHLSYAQAPPLDAADANGRVDAPELPADLAAQRAHILAALERLRGISRELDVVAQGAPAIDLAALGSEIQALQTEVDGIQGTLLRVHFSSGSAVLALSMAAQRSVLAVAERADRILIRGRTDASGTLAGNQRLAQARARSMQDFLVAGGIATTKMRVSALAGDYIAPNVTRAGRAVNRRVDVVFEATKPMSLPVSDAVSGGSGQ